MTCNTARQKEYTYKKLISAQEGMYRGKKPGFKSKRYRKHCPGWVWLIKEHSQTDGRQYMEASLQQSQIGKHSPKENLSIDPRFRHCEFIVLVDKQSPLSPTIINQTIYDVGRVKIGEGRSVSRLRMGLEWCRVTVNHGHCQSRLVQYLHCPLFHIMHTSTHGHFIT